MKEDFLHHIWLHKRINVTQLFTTNKEKIEIFNFGQYLQTSGPDFFNAQIAIENQKWVGNIEIHVKASDWYLHHHETDDNYNNVILHVVWENDAPIFRKDNTIIPTLELKNYVSLKEQESYLSLMNKKSWIYCENQLKDIDSFIFKNWKERLYFERLEQKTVLIDKMLQETNNDWEAVFFRLLAKNFGLNINGEAFAKMAKAIPFSIIRKEQDNAESLEAIFFGLFGCFNNEKEDVYFKTLKLKWQYLAIKYKLESVSELNFQFYKLRPDNFPTIRLAQLAKLFACQPSLFSKLTSLTSIKSFYEILQVMPSSYWFTHYNFDTESAKSQKRVSKKFIDLLLINSILPLLYVYSNYFQLNNRELILDMMASIKPERNVVVDKFKHFGCAVDSTIDSQALLQLKKQYCEKNKCLKCAIGVSILKK